MVTELTHLYLESLLETNMLGNLKIKNNMDKELTHGQMETNTLGNGKKVKNTDKELTRG